MSDNDTALTTAHLRILLDESRAIRAMVECGFVEMDRQLERIHRQLMDRKREERMIAGDV